MTKLSNVYYIRAYINSSNVITQPQIGIVASAFSYINTGLTSKYTNKVKYLNNYGKFNSYKS